MAEKMVTGNKYAEAGLKAMDDAIVKFRGSAALDDDIVQKFREKAHLEVVESIKDMEILSEKQVESAQKLVRSKHPLNKIRIWQALPFLSYIGKITSGWGGGAG